MEAIWDFSGCVFSNVTIGQNEVVSIATDPENTDDDTIEALEFSISSMYSVPQEVFTKFPNLKKFYADGQNIHEITPDTFKDANKLKVIQLQRNLLTFLLAETFKSKEFLESYHIFYNFDFRISFKRFVKSGDYFLGAQSVGCIASSDVFPLD